MKEAMHAWAGRLLRVDLASSKMSSESIEEYANRFIGGRGIGQWIVFGEVNPKVGAFDPENRIAFSAGPLTGTLSPGSARTSVDTKNVFTGGAGSSNCGGHFGPELKYAGFDSVVIYGKSSKPVYLFVNDGKAKIMDASHVWGRTTWDTEDMLKEEVGDKKARVASIGPAGENLVTAASIIVDSSRAFGRCGVGAVMGSKRLKAIVIRGTGAVSIAHPEEFMSSVNKVWERIEQSPWVQGLRKGGTVLALMDAQRDCSIAVRNFQDEHWSDEKVDRLIRAFVGGGYEVGRVACFNCPLFCSHFYRVSDGPYAGRMAEGLEANTAVNFGSRLDVDYPPAIIEAQALCSQLGLDVDNAATAISWAFELFENGILTMRDTDGLELKWGDHEVALTLLKNMAYRKGLGDLLADGVKRASERLGRGSKKYAFHIKGQNLYESLRSDKGWALGVVVAPRGGGHLDGAPNTGFMKISPDLGEAYFGTAYAGDPSTYEGKAKVVFWHERFKAVIDMLGVCYYVSAWVDLNMPGPEEYAVILSAASGTTYTGTQLMEIGRRVHNVEKAFNTLHAGFARQDDYPPKRLMEESIKSGRFKGARLDYEKWSMMLDEYYELHGWDKETGWQTEETLEQLGLREVRDKLEPAGKLPR